MPSLRPAIATDLPALGLVHVRAWREAYPQLLPEGGLARLTPGAKSRLWEDVLAQGESALTVVQAGPRLLGFGCCGSQRSAALLSAGFSGEVSSLYLLREAQGQGFGRALMAEMARTLLFWGHGSMALWTLAGNESACGFYAHLGGRPVARQVEPWGGALVAEVAFGWRDLAALAASA